MSTFLFFGAHPDDIERWAGGTVSSLTRAGHAVHMVSLTSGQRGSYGDPATRKKEFESAADHLGATPHLLSFVDGCIEATASAVIEIATCIREYRPEFIFAPYCGTSPEALFGIHAHQDHAHCGMIVKRAVSLAMMGWVDKLAPHRVDNLLYYMLPPDVVPNRFFSVSREDIDRALEAVELHASQAPAYKGPGTLRDYLLSQRMFHKRFGLRLVGNDNYSEFFLAVQPLVIDASRML